MLQHGSGVCQDFTHLMIGIARALKIPARYVSGYLHPDSEHHHLSVQPGIDEPLIHAVGSAGQRRSGQGRSENRSQPRAALRSARDFQPHPGAGRGGRAGGAGQPSHCGGRGRGRSDRSHGNASLPAGRQHAGKSAERSAGTRRKLAHGCGGGTQDRSRGAVFLGAGTYRAGAHHQFRRGRAGFLAYPVPDSRQGQHRPENSRRRHF